MPVHPWSPKIRTEMNLFNVIRKPEYWSALDNPFVFRKLGGFTLKALDGLKHIQDAWTLNRLRETRNARVLEIGGGVSRVLPAMDESNERWNLDEFLGDGNGRSEEHTSEPQSLMRISYAVYCLKKKNQNKN